MSLISTHVLDVAAGRPAARVQVRLIALDSDSGSDTETLLAQALTDADGRVAALGPDTLAAGVYLLRFHVGEYFAGRGQTTLYPRITIEFLVGDDGGHLHLPVLISPFAHSTYRGS